MSQFLDHTQSSFIVEFFNSMVETSFHAIAFVGLNWIKNKQIGRIKMYYSNVNEIVFASQF